MVGGVDLRRGPDLGAVADRDFNHVENDAVEVEEDAVAETDVVAIVAVEGRSDDGVLADAAEAREAVYSIDSGSIVLTGDVLLTQGPTVMAGQKLTVNLKDGSGLMEGQVTTTFVPGGN